MSALFQKLSAAARHLIGPHSLREPPPLVHGQDAATRLVANGRIPINIWGDVLLDGSPPQIRRVITGQDAHESLLVFFYLAEILSLQEIVEAIPRFASEVSELRTVLERFECLKRATKDPQHHANNELLQVFIPAALFIDVIGAENTEFCELGCSFFSSIDKLKICNALLQGSIDFSKVRWAAVDHSEFFLRGASSFHKADAPVRFADYGLWEPASPHPFHLSRFVASYALNSTEEFSAWMNKFAAFHVIDVINLEAEDFVTSNNGLRQVFFNFPGLVSDLEKAGWIIFVNELVADFNSDRPCAVVKMFGVKQALDKSIRIQDRVAQLKDLQEVLPMERIKGEAAGARVKELRDSKSSEEWRALAAYKKHFPIWGQPIQPMNTVQDVRHLIRPPAGSVDLTFKNGQINYYVKHALGDQ